MSKRNACLGTHQGFTLIELLVVIAISAILVIIATPAFITYLQTNRLTGASQNLYDALQYARSAAIKTNTNVYVYFKTGSSWCYGINASSACNCNTASSCSLGSTSANTSSSLSLSATGLSANTIKFEPKQGAAGQASTITLTNAQGNAISVEVGISGDLLLCSTTLSGYAAC